MIMMFFCCAMCLQNVLGSIYVIGASLYCQAAIDPQTIQGSRRRTLSEYRNSLSPGACQEDVAASTSVRHAGLSQARRLADARHKTDLLRYSEIIANLSLAIILSQYT